MAYTKDGINLNVCAYCTESIDEFSRTVDHLFPKSRGGILSNKNKRPCCGKCNKLKGDMDVIEFQRALNAMIFLEHVSHKERIGYLKKVRINTEKIIQEVNGTTGSLRHSTTGSRKDREEKS